MSPALASSDLIGSPLWEAVPDGLLIVDGRGIILAANPQLCDMIGGPSDGLVGQPLSVLVPDHARDTHAGLAERYMSDPAPRPMAAGGRLVARRHDGSELPVMISLAPVTLGGAAAVLASVRDVSESVVVEQRLSDATRRRLLMELRERLGRDLHDTVIQELFAVGMALQAVQPLAPEGPVADRIGHAVDRLDATIRDIRDAVFGRRSGHDPDSLSSRIISVAAELTPALGFAPRVTVAPDIDSIVPRSIADHIIPTVREALANVARHAGAVDVDVDVMVDGSDVVVRVLDDGIGIPQPLKRASGLANLRRRAEDLGGVFEIGPGAGAGSALVWRAPMVGDRQEAG